MTLWLRSSVSIFALLFFLTLLSFSFPKTSNAKMYTWDPVGLSYVVVESPVPCPVTWYMFYNDGRVMAENYIPAAHGGGTSRLAVIMNRVLFLLEGTLLRGEQIYFGYRIIPSSGTGCENDELVTMENRIVDVEEVEFIPTVKIRTHTLRNPNYVYHLITFPNDFKVHIYTLPFDPQPPYVERDTFHPVIFIHGLGGKPTDWTTGNKKIYWEKFLEAGYPEDFLATYYYADSDGNPDTYDYQGDITKLDDDLPTLVDELAQRYEEKYGSCDGECVDVVAFSLGGVVTRQYLNEHMFDNKLRKVVTIGTPHQGSQLMQAFDWAQSVPVGGDFLKKALEEAANVFLFSKATLEHYDQPIDVTSEAAVQMYPNSNFLEILNSFLYSNTSFHTLYGNIDAFFSQKLFHYQLDSPRISVGDVLIATDSASTVPAIEHSAVEYSDKTNVLRGNILLVKKEKTYTYGIDFPTIDDIDYFHSKLPTQKEVVEEALKHLQSN